jgi:hypothetical protein
MRDIQCINENDLAAELAVPVQTLRLWRSKKTGAPFTKINSSVKYRVADVDAYLLP